MRRLLVAAGSVLAVMLAGAEPVVSDPPPMQTRPTASAVTGDEQLEGLPLYVYGHSIAAGQGASGLASWANRLTGRHRLLLAQRAVGGDLSEQTVGRLIGTTGTAWTSGTGLVVLQDALNDVRRYGATATGLTGYRNDLTAMLTTLAASGRVEDTAAAFSYSGSWGTSNYPYASAGELHYTSTVGAWVDVTWAGDVLNLLLWELAGDTTAVKFTTPTGLVLRTVTLTGDGGGAVVNANPVLEQFTGYGAGQHTIRMYHDAGGGNLYADAMLPLSPAPPQVVVVKDSGVADWSGYAPFNLGSADALAQYNQITDDVVSQFPNATSVAVPGWDTSTMLSADGIHPNDRGHAQIADAVDAGLTAAVPDYRPGVNSN